MTPCQLCGSKRAKRSARVADATSKEVFVSNLFQVQHWASEKAKTTEVWFMPGYSLTTPLHVSLEGHIRIRSDSACIKQFKPVEQIKLIKAAIQHGIRRGEDSVRSEFRSLMQVRRGW